LPGIQEIVDPNSIPILQDSQILYIHTRDIEKLFSKKQFMEELFSYTGITEQNSKGNSVSKRCDRHVFFNTIDTSKEEMIPIAIGPSKLIKQMEVVTQVYSKYYRLITNFFFSEQCVL
jgi:hypothetical protein